MRTVRLLTWLWVAVALGAFAVTIAVDPSLESLFSSLAFGGPPLVLGVFVNRAVPEAPVGSLLAFAGAGSMLAQMPYSPDGPLAGLWMLHLFPLALLLFAAPSGVTRTRAVRRWWAIGIGIVAAFNALIVLGWAWPAAQPALQWPAYALLLGYLAFLVAAVVAPMRRYRGAGPRERLRLRWIYLAGVSLPLTLLVCWAGYLILDDPSLVGVGLIVSHLALPAAVTIAVVKPELFDVDRLMLASVTVSILSLFVLALASVTAVIAGLLLLPWSAPVALAASVVLALASAPLYRRVRRGLARRIHPTRQRALGAIAELSTGVNEGTAEPEDLEAVLRRALGDDELMVAVHRLADHALVDLDGARVVRRGSPVRLRGEPVGAIIPSAESQGLVPDEICRAAGPLVEAVRMRAELSRSAAELAASRRRIIRVGYEERRRLERDIHDGAQQRLVALGMQLRVLQRTAQDMPSIIASLDTAVAELGTAVAELRRIAHGLRPAALDAGLTAALADLASAAPYLIELHVEAAEIPDDIAVTAYYVASEAVANAIKHVDATRIRIDVHQGAQELSVRITDDGHGGAQIRPSAGLAGLADRVAGIGGRFLLDSPPGVGTTVEALLPCGS